MTYKQHPFEVYSNGYVSVRFVCRSLFALLDNEINVYVIVVLFV